MTVPWPEVKRRAEEIRRAAGHPIRTEAERAAAQHRLDAEILAFREARLMGGGPVSRADQTSMIGQDLPRIDSIWRGSDV